MQISVREAHVDLSDIDLDGVLSVEQIRVDAAGIALTAGASGRATGDVTAAIVVSEASVNRYLAAHPGDGPRDVEVAMLAGRLRVSGRWMLGPIGVPFAVLGVPEIADGARLRMDPSSVSFVGAALPNIGINMVARRINAELAAAFDLEKLRLPLRLTQILVEPGRMTLRGVAHLDLRPSDLRLTPFPPA